MSWTVFGRSSIDSLTVQKNWQALLADGIKPAFGQRGSKAIETGMANRLSPAQFNVLREEGTERPGSSPLNNEKRPGVFASSAVICRALKFIPKNGKESA
jgi:peptide-methionine (R)-S-oxide reductase